MPSLPPKCVIDTNVPKIANLALLRDPESDVPYDCVLTCINAIEHIRAHGGLVLDSGGEIFDEYRARLSLSGQPGIGDRFVKWVHDNQWNPSKCERVGIAKVDDGYIEFPADPDLAQFDISDRKFVAVSNKHDENPPILQAADSKWWGWRAALKASGIEVRFLCKRYIREKHKTKA